MLREDLSLAVHDRLRLLPIVHGSVEYTVTIRKLFLNDPPSAVALELPASLEESIARVVPHLDEIPVLSLAMEPSLHLILEPLEPLVEALRSAFELGIPYHLIDQPELSRIPFSSNPFPDTYALKFLSPLELYRLYLKAGPHRPRIPAAAADFADQFDMMVRESDRQREIFMAGQLRLLQNFVPDGGYLLALCGVEHIASIQRLLALTSDDFAEISGAVDSEPLQALLEQKKNPGLDAAIHSLSRQTPEVLDQPAYYNSSWLLIRNRPDLIDHFNRILLQRTAYRDAVHRYERESTEVFSRRKEKLFFRFTRNWSLIEGRLLPDLYKLVMAGRAFGGDAFARILYEILNYLPPLHQPHFPERELTLDEMYRASKLIRFRLKIKRKRPVPPPRLIKRFQKEKYPGEWRTSWDSGQGICSYPPEDIQIEDFGRDLQKKARTLLNGTRQRSQEFTSSYLDGIDYRETIRNLHLGKIIVREEVGGSIDAGSVVIVFDEDDNDYPWQMVWYGEHSQESDMAMYATMPGQEIVGPGISRCVYGGLLMTYPPGRLHNIWEDSHYSGFDRAGDKLLAAGIEYNEKNAVVHLAARAPSARLHALAGRLGQKLVHIPLSTVSPVTIGRVRRFHVLDSRDRRDDAGDYIW